MQVQIVRASTRHKVLSEARRVLGPDPLVLAVRRQPKDGSDDFEWEAVVARETPMAEPRVRVRNQGVPRALADLRRELARQQSQGETDTAMLDLARRLSLLEGEVLSGLLEGRALPQSWLPLMERLEMSGYPKADALRLVQQLEVDGGGANLTPQQSYRLLRDALMASVSTAPADERLEPGLVVFCGSAGVGKTTMAAKLAADLCLGGLQRPILGVVKPRRGVGVESLRRCARTLGIDFVETASPAGFLELFELAKHQPVILDCVSVSPRDRSGLTSLKETFKSAPGAEIHTVIPATYGAQDFDAALSAFSTVGAKRLSVTRLDESPYVGRILAAASRAGVPIAYVSQGPRIPDDLVRPSLDALLNEIFSTEVSVSI